VACSGLAAVYTTAPHSAELAGACADIRSSTPYLPQHRRLLVHRMRSLPTSAIHHMRSLPTAIHRLPRLQIAIGVLVQFVG
jgi:hypothetical protein